MLVACLCAPCTHILKDGGSCVLFCKDEKFCPGSQEAGEVEVVALPQGLEKKTAHFTCKAD